MMSNILEKLKERLLKEGIDICCEFSIKEYNEKVKRFTLPDFGSDNTLAVVFGSTKTFWPNFVKYIKSVEEIPNNPVDTYFQHIIEEVIFKEEPFTNYEYEVRYEWSSPRSGKFVHVQTAGHLAGFAYYDHDSLWSCHREYGLWFVYRGVIIINTEHKLQHIEEPKSVLAEEIKDEIQKWSLIAKEERWQNFETRLKIRDACPIGKEKWRYSGDMLDYFFPLNTTKEEVIKRIKSST